MQLFDSAKRLASTATYQRSDETSLVKTSEDIPSDHVNCFERDNKADPYVDYEPLRFMDRSGALTQPKRYFRTFWRTTARRLLEDITHETSLGGQGRGHDLDWTESFPQSS